MDEIDDLQNQLKKSRDIAQQAITTKEVLILYYFIFLIVILIGFLTFFAMQELSKKLSANAGKAAHDGKKQHHAIDGLEDIDEYRQKVCCFNAFQPYVKTVFVFVIHFFFRYLSSRKVFSLFVGKPKSSSPASSRY